MQSYEYYFLLSCSTLLACHDLQFVDFMDFLFMISPIQMKILALFFSLSSEGYRISGQKRIIGF